MIHEIVPAVEEANCQLQDFLEGTPLPLERAGFTLENGILHSKLPKPGHMRRNIENREVQTDISKQESH